MIDRSDVRLNESLNFWVFSLTGSWTNTNTTILNGMSESTDDRLLHTTLSESSYFKVLLPYLAHMSDDQLKALPVDYFKHHAELDIVFRQFHESHIVVLRTIDTRVNELMTLADRFRGTNSYQQVLDAIRRIPPRSE
jgi:hypothetical protein